MAAARPPTSSCCEQTALGARTWMVARVAHLYGRFPRRADLDQGYPGTTTGGNEGGTAPSCQSARAAGLQLAADVSSRPPLVWGR
jgi:hypothetical protein